MQVLFLTLNYNLKPMSSFLNCLYFPIILTYNLKIFIFLYIMRFYFQYLSLSCSLAIISKIVKKIVIASFSTSNYGKNLNNRTI